MRRVRLAPVETQGQAVPAEAAVPAGAVEARAAKVVAAEARAAKAEAALAPLAVQAAEAARAVRPETEEPPAARAWMPEPAAAVARAATGSCGSNSDCQGGQVCYVGINSCGTPVGGHCVTRLPDGCSGCACLDIVSGSCPTGQGGRCFESGVAGGCWYCALPI